MELDEWSAEVAAWMAKLPAGTRLGWWSHFVTAEQPWAWLSVGVCCPRVEAEVGVPPLFGGTVWVVHAPWDDAADGVAYRLRVAPDLWAWRLIDDVTGALVEIETTAVGEPLPPDALAHLEQVAAELGMWHVEGSPAWSPPAVSAALADWARDAAGASVEFAWEPPPPEPPAPTGRMEFGRVTVNPAIQSGAPCVTGTRIQVSVLATMADAGFSVVDILMEYPTLTGDDVEAAIAWHAELGDLRFPRDADNE